MFRITKKYIHIILAVVIAVGCSDNSSVTDEQYEHGDASRSMSVSFATRSINIEDQYPFGRGENEETPYINDKFEEGAILYISQMGTTKDPVLFCTGDNSDPKKYGTPYDKETEKDNLYIYQYEPDTDADWNTGYNFVPYVNQNGNKTPLNWGVIRTLGSVGNSFSFYAIAEPNGKNAPQFRIGQWQNNYETSELLSKKLDKLGAYHATSSLYTRMRFKLYHLVNCIHVTLLVPEKEDNHEDEEPGYTGFNEKAFIHNNVCGGSQNEDLPGVWLGVPMWAVRQLGGVKKGLNTNFDINWRASRSSDVDPPKIRVITDAGYSNNDDNHCLYMLKYDVDNPDKMPEPFKLENVKDFYPDYENKNHPDYDIVRRYEFVGYFLGQKFENAYLSIRLLTPDSSGELVHRKNDPGSQDSNIKKSVDGNYVPYFYYGNTKGQNQQQPGSEFNIGENTQGVFQHVVLYVPRKGNETVEVSAKVIPWNETHTDMTLIERDEDDYNN